MTDLYVTTSIPYVNGAPHLGHALEFVHADVLARHRVQRGGRARLQSGTDDHAIKNVAAADAAGVRVEDLVANNGDRFVALADSLDIRTDRFVRTSRDPRHATAVGALWRACHERGDLYTENYSGLYCSGCEQFYTPEELDAGLCVEHRTPAAEVTETNWFFRLSRYRHQLIELIDSGRLDITPAERRNEVLGFLRGDLQDLSVSRPAHRTQGWGIPVPDDPTQVVYVWFDALTNYLTGVGYPNTESPDYQRWWNSRGERVHVLGKGIVRFHAVYWIAFLLSAELPLPTRILVHDYLTVNGDKIAKSGAQTTDVETLVADHGVDAARWWLLRDPAPVGTTDFTVERLTAAYNRDLANSLGNLTSRALALARRAEPWRTTATTVPPGVGDLLQDRTATLPTRVEKALARYDFRAACTAIAALAEEGNRFIESEAPWHLATTAANGDHQAAARFDAVLTVVLTACRAAAHELTALIPSGATRLHAQLDSAPTSTGERARAAFPRITHATNKPAE